MTEEGTEVKEREEYILQIKKKKKRDASMRISKCEVRNLYGKEKRLSYVLDDIDEQLANNSPTSTTVNTSRSIGQQ